MIDVAPLREEQFTGIPKVVKEVVRRALALQAGESSMLFSVGDALVDPDIVARTVEDAYQVIFCGREGCGPAFEQMIENYDLIEAAERGRIKHLALRAQRQGWHCWFPLKR